MLFYFKGKSESLMKIKVESQSDSKGHESSDPTSRSERESFGSKPASIAGTASRHAIFACSAAMKTPTFLKGPLEDGSWELVSFTHKDSRGTELEYEGKRELQ